jgi:hypothetical protein
LFPDVDGIPPPRVRPGVEATVEALRATGRIEAVDSALIALALTLADAIDAEATSPSGSRGRVASLTGRLHPILIDLRGDSGGGGGLGDALGYLGRMGDPARH